MGDMLIFFNAPAPRAAFDALVEKESPDVVVADYVSAAPFDICKEKKIPLVLNAALPGTLASWQIAIATYRNF